MAVERINDINQLINQQIESQEIIYENLIKAKSLLDVALAGSLLDHPAYVTHDYLWSLSDFVESVIIKIEVSLSNLIKNQQLKLETIEDGD